MPSVAHEAPIELIRQHPALAIELIRAMTGSRDDDDDPLPGKAHAALGPTDHTDIVPAQFLADMVVVVSDPDTGKPLAAIVIEPQGRDSPTKKFSWPVYLTAVRRTTGCPLAYLLVICPDPAEAEKCRQPIRLGQPGFVLIPIVIHTGNTPGTGKATPYLAVFAVCMGAISMEDEHGARHILSAIRDTGAPVADRKRLTAVILNLASDAARQILEAMMATTEWKSDFIDSYVEQGIEKGIEKGKAEYLLKILDARGIESTEQQQIQITTCTDPVQLDRWFDRALTAKTASDIFKTESKPLDQLA